MNSLDVEKIKLLTWEILRPNRYVLLAIVGILALDGVLNFAAELSFNTTGQAQGLVDSLNGFFYVTAAGLAFYTSTQTEFNSRKDLMGFPQRLFTLPVSTFTLLTIPVLLGLLLVELVFLTSHMFGTSLVVIENPIWVAFKLAVFLLNYQMIMWTLDKLGVMRLVLIGIVGFVLIVIDNPRLGAPMLSLWALVSCLLTWKLVTAKRSGGGRLQLNGLPIGNNTSSKMSKEVKQFSSVQDAQLWFEWRRAGFILPLCTLAVLGLVVLPLSILTRSQESATMLILATVLLLPLALAIPVGIGFSKGDPWSEEMEIPSFMLVRPLSSDDFILIRLKAAAISVVVTWLISLFFLLVWVLFWADLNALLLLGNFFWETQGHSLYPQIATGILIIIVGMLLTWRFMVSGLWIGLSKHRKLFVASAIPPILFLFVGINSLYELLKKIQGDFTQLSSLAWLAGFAVIVKFWMAAWSWRSIDARQTVRYLVFWMFGTTCMLVLSITLWSSFRFVIGFDVYLIQSLFIFIAMMLMPLTQIALAPSFLAANRHR